MDVSLTSSPLTPSPSPTSSNMDSSTSDVISTASSGTETTGATSAAAETASSTSSVTQSPVPSSTPAGDTTSTGTRSPTPSLTSMTSSTDSFTSTSSGFASSSSDPAFSTSVPVTSSVATSPTQSTVVPLSTSTVASVSSTSAAFTPSADTSISATTSPLTSSTSESFSLGETSTSGAATSTTDNTVASLWTTAETLISTTTIAIPETVYTTVSPRTSDTYMPYTSMYTMVSTLPGGVGTTTLTVTTSGVLSTAAGADAIGSDTSPGKIAAIVLGLVGAAVIVVLWIFCARRHHRKRERDAALLGSSRHLGPLEGEVFDDGEEPEYLRRGSGSTGPPVMEERYAGILAALHTGHTAGGSTDGVYGSHRDRRTNENGDSVVDTARASSPTLPFHANDDGSHITPLSPPPAVVLSSRPQTSTYVNPIAERRRRSSPGPDAAAWLSGHIAPSCASHYARSQTLGSGSGSCSVDALTRTLTGSEEPLLGAGNHPHAQTSGGNRLGLGSAFGSAEGSAYSPSYYADARSRTLSGSGSYAHTRSMASSSFDVLRSMSSQGALSSSHVDHGFGSGGVRSVSSDSMGRKKYRHGFGSPPSSFRVWRERGSSVRNKDDSKDRRRSTGSSNISVSASGSGDERKGRSSPAYGVRGLLDRLWRVGHTPSPASSSRALPATPTKSSKDFDVERTAGIGGGEARPPTPVPIQAPVPTSSRSYIVSNPNPCPPSPFLDTNVAIALTPQHNDELYNPYDSLRPPTLPYASVPSPVPTEASCLPEGLLHPRLQVDGRSAASLRDFEDYTRPIAGLVKNRVYSTTTFGTADYSEPTPVHDAHELPGEPTDRPRESWFADESPRSRLCTTTLSS
ncbi:hypothetical protein BKA82DRAFT_29022 [Pisolithus tinctorius]|uniref:Uncharacterized protein n=1 Tax=Pisolithus tinctorius Marx 270 TaxID=870435 RepID=A0A0C3NJ78_PISTI|nr:hypothetical protein BKA82DRAFT_29022 [Pisolithus tinctorius]KIO01045.1 hypothetical protein M404DRAFT_29022 [Pisolithus tinctorius Marx 270]